MDASPLTGNIYGGGDLHAAVRAVRSAAYSGHVLAHDQRHGTVFSWHKSGDSSLQVFPRRADCSLDARSVAWAAANNWGTLFSEPGVWDDVQETFSLLLAGSQFVGVGGNTVVVTHPTDGGSVMKVCARISGQFSPADIVAHTNTVSSATDARLVPPILLVRERSSHYVVSTRRMECARLPTPREVLSLLRAYLAHGFIVADLRTQNWMCPNGSAGAVFVDHGDVEPYAGTLWEEACVSLQETLPALAWRLRRASPGGPMTGLEEALAAVDALSGEDRAQ